MQLKIAKYKKREILNATEDVTCMYTKNKQKNLLLVVLFPYKKVKIIKHNSN